MSVYFDASVIIPMFVEDVFNDRVDRFISRTAPIPVISDFVTAEVASALNLRVRSRLLTADDARQAFSDLDIWRGQAARACQIEHADIATAETFLRRLDLPLRAPDAIHIAIAQRLDLELATFDRRLAECADIIGVRLTAN